MRKMAVVLLCFILIFTVSSCGSPSEADLLETRNTDISPDLTFDHSMPLDYAEEFAVDYYNDGYALITISNGTQYLVIPEGKQSHPVWMKTLCSCTNRSKTFI